MNRSKIEWTDYTLNIITGCLKGCKYCYARKITQRFPNRYPRGFYPTFWSDRLSNPSRVKKPSMIFLNSMGEWMGEWVPYIWIESILDMIKTYPHHTFQTLTKNPKRLTHYEYPDNCWIGITIDSQKHTVNLKYLQMCNARIKFISFEPLREKIGPINLNGIHWIIIGAQTNPLKLPDPRWITYLITMARLSNTKIFMKNNLDPILIDSYIPKIQEFPEGIQCK